MLAQVAHFFVFGWTTCLPFNFHVFVAHLGGFFVFSLASLFAFSILLFRFLVCRVDSLLFTHFFVCRMGSLLFAFSFVTWATCSPFRFRFFVAHLGGFFVFSLASLFAFSFVVHSLFRWSYMCILLFAFSFVAWTTCSPFHPTGKMPQHDNTVRSQARKL